MTENSVRFPKNTACFVSQQNTATHIFWYQIKSNVQQHPSIQDLKVKCLQNNDEINIIQLKYCNFLKHLTFSPITHCLVLC